MPKDAKIDETRWLLNEAMLDRLYFSLVCRGHHLMGK